MPNKDTYIHTLSTKVLAKSLFNDKFLKLKLVHWTIRLTNDIIIYKYLNFLYRLKIVNDHISTLICLIFRTILYLSMVYCVGNIVMALTALPPAEAWVSNLHSSLGQTQLICCFSDPPVYWSVGKIARDNGR